MRNFIIIINTLFLFGCGQTKTVLFSTNTFMSGSKIEKFEIKVPKGFKSKMNNLEIDLLNEYIYSDNSTFYISLDITYANSPNKGNWSKCSDPNTGKKCRGGTQEDGKYWREELIENLVVGYFNVPESRKTEFDKAISSLIKK